MSVAINVDVIAPKSSADINVLRGRTRVIPTDSRSIVSKSYVDALAANVTSTSGSFDLTWQWGEASYPTQVYYVKPNSHTAILTFDSFTFTGWGGAISAVNTIPAALVPGGPAWTDSSYVSTSLVPVTAIIGEAAAPSVIDIPRNVNLPIVLRPGNQNGYYPLSKQYMMGRATIVYPLYEP